MSTLAGANSFTNGMSGVNDQMNHAKVNENGVAATTTTTTTATSKAGETTTTLTSMMMTTTTSPSPEVDEEINLTILSYHKTYDCVMNA